MKQTLLSAFVAFIVAAASVAGDSQAPGSNPPAARVASPSATPPSAVLVTQYCVTCHSARAKAGGLALDPSELTQIDGHAETWEKVIRKVQTGMMPPSGSPRPARAVLEAFVASLQTQIDRAAAARPFAGTPALHRLNRAEYSNAIRDLLALDVDAASLLPPDDSAAGFDNIADVLGVSPALIEGYATAAAKISRLAVGDPSIGLDRVTYRVAGSLSQEGHLDGLPLGTRGGMIVRHTFPLDADYDLQIGPGRSGGLGAVVTARAQDIDVAIDGRPVDLQGKTQVRLPIDAGPHTIAVALVKRSHIDGADGVYDAPTRAPGISQITIAGPFNARGPGDAPSRRRLYVCTPAAPADEAASASAKATAGSRRSSPEITASEDGCAAKILNTLATRAYRRPVPPTGAEMDTLLGFYRAGRETGSFDTGIQRAVARVLVDPNFLFRFEREPANVAPGTPYRLSDLELASRLSFFLWSSIPDDELRETAVRGQLKNPAVLEKQVRRLLADPRADALVSNFAGQWLFLRELKNVRPDSPDFDENLRRSFQQETELLFRAIVREDRPIIDLLDADFTFVDERLATHYGMEGIRGSRVRRVALAANHPRRGLLGHGSVLTVTSAANRTSPVVRGKWVLENLLGTPPPQPPPGVETNLEKDAAQVKVTSLRQRLELHRANPVCAACHNVMDPIGLTLENFDHVGKWRTVDGKAPINATAQLVDGTKLDGPETLRRALLARSDVFATVATEKLLTYATGRAVQYQDMPAVRAIIRDGSRDEYRFSSLVLGIVKSTPFQMRTKAQP
jgi:mono/diheme cytochrome c family protein